MANFDDIQLRKLDITLLLVFEETLATGKLSAAAKRLNLTPSAVSHALRRLRDTFGDELFTRGPGGVRPTPRALALRPAVSEALRHLRAALRPARVFDPAQDPRVFRLAGSDYVVSLLAPKLLGPQGAHPDFVFRTLVRREAIAALEAGEIDIALGYTGERGHACQSATLLDESYLVVARTGHPAFDGGLDLRRYTAAGHVLVAHDASLAGIVDRSLARIGAARRVVLGVPYFLAALATVAATDLLATVPRRLARAYAPAFGLQVADPPLPIRAFTVQMIWNRRGNADPALAWLRAHVTAAAAEIP